MPRQSGAKIVSAPKLNTKSRNNRSMWLWGSALLLVAVLALLLSGASSRSRSNALNVNGNTFFVEKVSSNSDLARGLSGRSTIANNQAMLFDFKRPEKPCIWMKDMKFAIDIVWVDAQKKVVHLQKNVRPETYPAQFCPEELAQYVLEVRAGRAEEVGLGLGAVVSFR